MILPEVATAGKITHTVMNHDVTEGLIRASLHHITYMHVHTQDLRDENYVIHKTYIRTYTYVAGVTKLSFFYLKSTCITSRKADKEKYNHVSRSRIECYMYTLQSAQTMRQCTALTIINNNHNG